MYYILDYFGILFVLDLNSMLREFILWDHRLLKRLFCEKIIRTKVLLNNIFSVLNIGFFLLINTENILSLLLVSLVILSRYAWLITTH